MKTRGLLFFFLLVGCSSETTKTDGGGDETPSCGGTFNLCSGGGPSCATCAPSDGTSCDPAGLQCNYTNGCSGAELSTANCTCLAPDAGPDAADAEAGAATWHCLHGV